MQAKGRSGLLWLPNGHLQVSVCFIELSMRCARVERLRVESVDLQGGIATTLSIHVR